MFFDKKIFGDRLRKIRKQNGKTQPDIADFIGVSTPQISEMETGKRTTTVEKLALICEYYNVSADYLLGLTDNPTPFQRKESK